MKICSKCGCENNPNALSCESCNTLLPRESDAGSVAPPSFGSPQSGQENLGGQNNINRGFSQPVYSQEMKNCPCCNQQINKFATVCSFCGTVFNESYISPKEVIPKGTHSEATQSLIFGILSLFCCAIIFGPLAITKANNALSSISLDPGYEGEGLAKAGKVLGIIGLVLWGIGIIINIFSFASR